MQVDSKSERAVNYKFNKNFHVSPFMDMEHLYDWDFSPPKDRIMVSTTMIKGDLKYFNGCFNMEKMDLTPLSLSYCMVRYPLITWVVQFLIHLQAFHLWMKKVPFYPHPQGTETWASNLVGVVMAPLWRVQEWMESGSSKTKEL